MRTPKTFPMIDERLLEELRSPGADNRFGVNVIARPPAAVRKLIRDLQTQIQKRDPGQYFYPEPDLHLTVFEIVSGADANAGTQLEQQVRREIGEAMKSPPHVRLSNPHVRIDEAAAAVSFTGGLEQMEAFRNHLAARLTEKQIRCAPRATSPSAHVTFMRFLKPSMLGSTSFPVPKLEWDLNEVWMTAGATWYGMRARIREIGPFELSSNRS